MATKKQRSHAGASTYGEPLSRWRMPGLLARASHDPAAHRRRRHNKNDSLCGGFVRGRGVTVLADLGWSAVGLRATCCGVRVARAAVYHSISQLGCDPKHVRYSFTQSAFAFHHFAVVSAPNVVAPRYGQGGKTTYDNLHWCCLLDGTSFLCSVPKSSSRSRQWQIAYTILFVPFLNLTNDTIPR